MMPQPAQNQTKLLLIGFSSIILIVLIGALTYKYWYTNPFPTYETSAPLSLELGQSNPITIKLVPDKSSVRVGESVTYSLISSETTDVLGLSVKLVSQFDGGSLNIDNSLEFQLETGTSIINQTALDNGVAQAELAVITSSTQNPIVLTEGATIAQLTVTPTSVGSGTLIFGIEGEDSMVSMIIEETRPVILETEPVLVTQ